MSLEGFRGLQLWHATSVVAHEYRSVCRYVMDDALAEALVLVSGGRVLRLAWLAARPILMCWSIG